MNADPTQRRSRTYWPAPGSDDDDHHTCHLSSQARLLLTGLCVYVIALTMTIGVMLVDSRQIRELREQQLEQIREEIRIGQCDLLDQLPEGGLLERPRAKYECGPGYPQSEIDPQQRDEQADIIAPPAPLPTPTVLPDGPRTMNNSLRE